MKKPLVIICTLLALTSLGLAVVYFSKTAGSLPHFLPGYLAGSTHKHTKHGVICTGLAIVLFLGAWMFSGKSEVEENDSKK